MKFIPSNDEELRAHFANASKDDVIAAMIKLLDICAPVFRANEEKKSEAETSRIKGMLDEIDRLHRVIAKELTEDDSLGAEYTYVVALKTENKRLRDALEWIVNSTIESGTHKTAQEALK